MNVLYLNFFYHKWRIFSGLFFVIFRDNLIHCSIYLHFDFLIYNYFEMTDWTIIIYNSMTRKGDEKISFEWNINIKYTYKHVQCESLGGSLMHFANPSFFILLKQSFNFFAVFIQLYRKCMHNNWGFIFSHGNVFVFLFIN